MQQTIEYSDLDDALRRCGASWNAAQAHGLLCSRLCLSGRDAIGTWIAAVQDGGDRNSAACVECAAMMAAVSTNTLRDLAQRQSQFMPLLPDDSFATTLRTEALGNWCEGFLHGLVSGEHSTDVRARMAAEPLSDIIRDLLEITRAAVDENDDRESNEEAYVELVEYIRVAAQLAYEELAEFRPTGVEFAAVID
jgi:hypothetical protein